MKLASALAAAAVLGLVPPALAAGAVNTGHDVVEFVTGGSVAPGGSVYVALRQRINPGWHTYWRNAGDSGEPPRVDWILPRGWRAGPIVWPTPSKLPIGPLMNYGYKGEVLLPIALTAPKDARRGDLANLRAHVSLLVCSDICIPEHADLSLQLPLAAVPQPDHFWGAKIAEALRRAPKLAKLTAIMHREGDALKLAVVGPELVGIGHDEVYFFAGTTGLIDHAQPQTMDRGPKGVTLKIAPGLAFRGAGAPKSIEGVLIVGARAYQITAHDGVLPIEASSARDVKVAGTLSAGLIVAMAFAFLGGLILNVMPCVLPILSLKALALIQHAGEPRQVRREGLAFLMGVMGSFLGLSSLLLSARAAGAAVGWGFQMQSPPVVAALALIMLLVALNLAGVFEIGLSVQSVASAAPNREGEYGAFFTGALAVVLAAPCTAPFMATAIAYALVQTPLTTFAVFSALGLGFAAPFLVLSFAPGLASHLPKAGRWMETLKSWFAYPMLATAVWLTWVLTLQAGADAMAALLTAGIIVAIAARLLGAAQKKTGSGRQRVALRLASVAALVAAIGVTAAGLGIAQAVPLRASASLRAGQSLASVPYSPEVLARLRAEGKTAFVDFTAAWCVTCQVNERMVLSQPDVARAFAKTGAIYMKADWTLRDTVIAKALADQGRAGVPLYLVYGAKDARPEVLPQILTQRIVEEALEHATRTQIGNR